MTRILIARAGEGALGAALLDSMYRLRHEVFHQRLGWDVRSEGEREHDWFDAIGPYHLVAYRGGEQPQAVGCCRFLPSQGPNMLRDVFPELLDGATAPSHQRVWEVSRFAVKESHTEGRYGFSGVPRQMLSAVVGFAFERGIDALIGVTSAAFARMLQRVGFKLEVLGRPRRIGQVLSLAFRLPIDEETRLAVCGPAPEAAWRDAA